MCKKCPDQLLRRCVDYLEAYQNLSVCHNTPDGEHFRGTIIVAKVPQSGYIWASLFKDVNEYVKTSDICPRM